ncbi:Enoyl-CoA hydratase/isomerase [Desulfamplus magnetovallimortis]|uniref:Enoyl-CoA hydratase domain-containing protein 3, mitochondrial n=1 Tax=Desulfamplus magnetovallimortis TaxID=1246637 RepID=A0A1W1HFS8_9BACT|nr:enoyl-CoA hydratase-related protein [Desulfamplus magnetovallimortis]SLM31339.1 Enoyl-CoA hydratase/isomerase [Desulfamplus magnetovallimortis]
MQYQTILVDNQSDNIGVICLNRPDHLNTFSTEMADELYSALMAFENDPAVRVIVLKGEGKAFCAGIDVNELAGKSTIEYRRWIERMEKPLVEISRMKKPVIAQVQGVAAANGMGLVASADIVIAAENVKMGLTAINVGLNCVGPVIPVARSVGRKKALELLLYGRLIKAQEALDMGLINKIVPKDQLEDETMKWAKELAVKSPIAVQIAKSAFYASEDLPYTSQFDFMNEAFARLCSTDDAKEGVAAFFEKRNPVWQEK